MTEHTRAVVLTAVAQRLRCATDVLLEGTPDLAGNPPVDVHTMLEALVLDLQVRPDAGRVWLVLSVLSAQFPLAVDVRAAQRRLELLAPRDAIAWFLAWSQRCTTWDDLTAEIEIVTEHPLVDVDTTAASKLSTGIQRVVRNLLPIWAEEHELTLAGWEGGAYVRLDATQTGSILGKPDLAAPRSRRRLIPWGVPVLLPEVAKVGRSERLAALAEHSANFVGVLGYDCIPAVSAELVPEIEREKFGEYLEIVKYADVVACISQAAADEFSGFVGALEAQGVRGPVVVACGLPTSVTVEDRPKASPQGGLAEVLCVGSLDPRKNQIALVEAAEHLWRDGLTFRLRLIGSGGAQPVALKRLIGRLVRAGRPIVVGQEVTDASLHRAYCDARVVVFPTLHEGFGLPVVEALSYGVPVITSDFGSTREIAEGNGAVLVDPEDVWALASALRDVLTDDELHARLSRQATSRPTRTWDDYGAELWKALVP